MFTDKTSSEGRRAAFWQLLALLALLSGTVLMLTACGGQDTGQFTPPPATIIRASDSNATAAPNAQPQATAPQEQATPLPATPAADGTPSDYPPVWVSPAAVTPIAYPTVE